jgi:secreted PhoX family phosphatase
MQWSRRQLIRLSALAGGAAVVGLGVGRCAGPRATRPPPATFGYGPLAETPDAQGLRLPTGFRSRILARTGEPVPGTDYVWHPAPDGGACFPMADGGWVYASNSEVRPNGGVGAVRFAADGRLVDAYRILTGTQLNCAGGPSPWGTWLTCEEFDDGHVWECDPARPSQGVVRPALGTFAHEALSVDPVERRFYLTEDRLDGRFYRFTPAAWPSLEAGTLEAAWFSGDTSGGEVRWVPVSAKEPASRGPAASSTTAFRGGEGCWFHEGTVFFTTKVDNRVWAYTVATQRLRVVYDAQATPAEPLRGVDNLVVSRLGETLVAEDGDDMQLCLLGPQGQATPFLQLLGHRSSELAGPAFSPDGTRLYFSSQRGSDGRGVTFEVTGPFRT